MSMISRRNLILGAAAAGTAAQLGRGAPAHAAPAGRPWQATASGGLADGVPLRWLEGGAPRQPAAGSTWGVPWPKGSVPADQAFALRTAAGQQVPVQTARCAAPRRRVPPGRRRRCPSGRAAIAFPAYRGGYVMLGRGGWAMPAPRK